jgi:SAM-dependent methyltransferase
VPGAERFYDELAGDYHLLFADWWAAARVHGEVLAGLLAARGVVPPAAVLDCACGIGTQALPLAAAGYRVVGTDVSAAAVRRARAEAGARGLAVDLRVADVRRLRPAVDGGFDAVVCCDNALPHLLTDDDLADAAGGIRACLPDGGVLVASTRDYDALRRDRPAGTPVVLHGGAGRRAGAGQGWAWTADGEFVDITLFLLRESAVGWRVSAHETRYRALRRDVLTSVLRSAGFGAVDWVDPADSGYFQPVVVAVAGRPAPAG